MAFGKLRVDEIETSTQTVSVDAVIATGADGDKGDITVSGAGTIWTIGDGAVDTAALGGDITAAGKALLDDADAAAQRTTLGLAAVASTGAYADLSGKPTIPTGADALPQNLGTAAIGASADYAREDHVHAMPSATDVGADPTGTAAGAISTHEAAADPHPGYALESSLATVATTGAYGDLTGTPALVANLDDLGDVDLITTPPADGEGLVYDSATGNWVPGAAGATAAGSANQIQYNDGSSGLAASADLTWDDTGKVLGVGGDIDLDDGGTYTTTLQTITATANRTISLPDATGTVALVAGSSGQLIYNNAGANAGVPTSAVGATGDITLSLNGAASTPPLKLTGTWFVGANSKPHVLIEPSGTTSTTWSTSGTGLGVNAPSGFTGNLLDLQVNGTKTLSIAPNSTNGVRLDATTNFGLGYSFYLGGAFRYSLATTAIRLSTSSSAILFGLGESDTPSLARTELSSPSAGVLEQKNGTNAQTYRLYNTYTGASNYQRTSITDDSTGLVIDQQYAGTGAARTNLLDLKNNGTSQFEVSKDGIVEGLYFINRDVTGVQYFFGANLYARMSVGLASGTQFGWTSSAISPNGARDTGLKRDQAGVVAITNGSTGTGYLKQTPVAVSALPAAATVGAGTRGFVSDSTVAASGNFGATVTGGGSNNVPVFSDGTNWLIG